MSNTKTDVDCKLHKQSAVQKQRLTKASSTANPVHVRLPVLRHIQINHQIHFLCIYTA